MTTRQRAAIIQSYKAVCPFCGVRLLGFTGADYVRHLTENGRHRAAEEEAEQILARRANADG